jgi:uncharacterized protein (TIGR02588 family)
MNIPKKNRMEWSVFLASALIVLATLGYLGVSAIRGGKSPADLRVLVGTPGKHADVHRVPIVVRNLGESTAESVRIEVVLRRGEEEVERAELDLAFVPRKSEREGWVTFRSNPRCCAIVARAVGYERP